MPKRSPSKSGQQPQQPQGQYGSRKQRSPRKAVAVAPHESPALNGGNGSIRGSPASSSQGGRKRPERSPTTPNKTKSVLSSPRKRAERRKYAKHRRGVSFADQHNKDLTEVHEIERRANARRQKKAQGCCAIQ